MRLGRYSFLKIKRSQRRYGCKYDGEKGEKKKADKPDRGAVCLLTVISDSSYNSGRGDHFELQPQSFTAENLRFRYPTGLPKSAGKKTSAATTSSTSGVERRDLAEYGMTYNLLALNQLNMQRQRTLLHYSSQKRGSNGRG